MAFRLGSTLCVVFCCGSIAVAQDHSHEPQTLPQAPSISRLKVAFAIPHRVTVDQAGTIFTADIRAGVVFRTAPDGLTSVLADGLNQPVAVRTDEAGNTYIAAAARGRTGAGRIYAVNAEGERQTLAGDLTGPTDFLRAATGELTIALGGKDQIIAIDADGKRKTLCDRISNPTALANGPDGELFIASGKGQVFQLLANGRLQKLADGLKSPTDFGITHDGRLVVAQRDAKQLAVIDRDGTVKQYAKVPQGTVSVAFSPAGNMVIANRSLQSVTRVTTRLSVPCPHCDKSIPVILKKPKPGRAAF